MNRSYAKTWQNMREIHSQLGTCITAELEIYNVTAYGITLSENTLAYLTMASTPILAACTTDDHYHHHYHQGTPYSHICIT